MTDTPTDDEALEKVRRAINAGIFDGVTDYGLARAALSALRQHDAELTAAEVCHDEQMTIWASEVLEHFIDWLKPVDYEDTLAMNRAAADAARDIIESAFSLAAWNRRNAESGMVTVPRAEIQRLIDGNYEIKRSEIFRDDGVHSKHDKCIHGAWVYAGCEDCLTDALAAMLAAAQEATTDD